MTCQCLKCYFCGKHLTVDASIFCDKHPETVFHGFSKSVLDRVHYRFQIGYKKYELAIYFGPKRLIIDRVEWDFAFDGEMNRDFIKFDCIPEFTPENLPDKIKTWTVFS
jgi:hypothetical protein